MEEEEEEEEEEKCKEEIPKYEILPEFETYFPGIKEGIMNIKHYVDIRCWYTYRLSHKKNKYRKQNIDSNILRAIPEWNNLMRHGDGKVASHIMLVIYCILNNSSYKELTKREQNILLWSALLHDISKTGSQLEHKIHPFKGAVVGISLLTRLFNIEGEREQKVIGEYAKELGNSVFYTTKTHLLGTSTNKYYLDIQRGIRVINDIQATHFFGRDILLFIKLIAFHQSIPIFSKINMKNDLELQDVKELFLPCELNLVKILVTSDGLSHHLKNNWKTKAFTERINKYFGRIYQYIDEHP